MCENFDVDSLINMAAQISSKMEHEAKQLVQRNILIASVYMIPLD